MDGRMDIGGCHFQDWKLHNKFSDTTLLRTYKNIILQLEIRIVLFQTQLANTQAVAPYMDIVSNALHKITQPDTETQV